MDIANTNSSYPRIALLILSDTAVTTENSIRNIEGLQPDERTDQHY